MDSFQALVQGKSLSHSSLEIQTKLEDLSINVHEVEAILLLLQIWGSSWHRHKIIIHTDNSTAYSGLLDSTLKGLANAPLREIFFDRSQVGHYY